MRYAQYLSDTSLAIYLFHGVVEQSKYSVRNYTKKHLERDYFYSVLSDLKKVGYPLSMDQVIEHNRNSKPFPPNSFAVTFDDGFENNYSIAAPILKSLDIPATFYITTGWVQDNTMVWIDRIEHCFELTPAGGIQVPWDNNVYLRDFVRTNRDVDCDELVASIFSRCKIPEVHESEDVLDKKMSWKQIEQLSNDQLFTVGGHGHSHKILSFLDESDLEHEIAHSIKLLEENTKKSIKHYSYPEGISHCYNATVIKKLRDNKIVSSPTAERGTNTCLTDLFGLKRITVV